MQPSEELPECTSAIQMEAETEDRADKGVENLDERTLPEVLAVVPSADRVAVGRAFSARALLVGVERAVRDLRTRVE